VKVIPELGPRDTTPPSYPDPYLVVKRLNSRDPPGLFPSDHPLFPCQPLLTGICPFTIEFPCVEANCCDLSLLALSSPNLLWEEAPTYPLYSTFYPAFFRCRPYVKVFWRRRTLRCRSSPLQPLPFRLLQQVNWRGNTKEKLILGREQTRVRLPPYTPPDAVQ